MAGLTNAEIDAILVNCNAELVALTNGEGQDRTAKIQTILDLMTRLIDMKGFEIHSENDT